MARLFVHTGPDFLEADTAAILAAPLTVCAWVRTNNLAQDQVALSLSDKDLTNHFFQLRFNSGGNNVHWGTRSGGDPIQVAATSTNVSVNTWHHYTGVEAATDDRRVYLDGGGKGTNSGIRTPVGLDRTTIGRAGDATPTREMRGDIAHVAIWNIALTDLEIAILAAGISPLCIQRDALIGYWPVGGQSPELDVVGGINLTINGTPAQSQEPPIPHSIVAPG